MADISKEIEKLNKEIKLIAKNIEIGVNTASEETITILREQLKELEKKRDLGIKNGEIIGDEVNKTKEVLDLNRKLLKTLEKSNTLFGQFEISLSNTSDYLRGLVTDFKEQYTIASAIAKEYKALGIDIGITDKNAKIM